MRDDPLTEITNAAFERAARTAEKAQLAKTHRSRDACSIMNAAGCYVVEIRLPLLLVRPGWREALTAYADPDTPTPGEHRGTHQ